MAGKELMPGAVIPLPASVGPIVHIRLLRERTFPIGKDAPSHTEDLAVLKEAIKEISAIQKECRCCCTVDVDMNW